MVESLVVGLPLILAGLLWRHRVLHRRQAMVAAALRSPDATVRSAALHSVAMIGLAPWCDVLLDLVETAGASDDAVAAELAWVITATQWEPADDARIVRLRAWAWQYHRSHPAEVAAAPTVRAAPVTPLAPLVNGTTTTVEPGSRTEPIVAPEPRPAPVELSSELAEGLLGERVVRASFRPRARRDPA